ncbi:3-phosphoshikimate 1-carboxyvinyltransferase [Risungbinella massiliensis]|uniref:3-phosphoshikimate 1-carboxyvinyltransferase n=1 Tax=Risungbinella massiliensis TaxID=1329796 RepID=UPI0005CB9A00|nr:3-phosphoshikimate 1-carboxyvinyltransferase [Risungbinella massiliensis]
MTTFPVSEFEWSGIVPGDKSISHRAVLLGSIAHGMTTVQNFLAGADCLSTIRCIRQLGVKIEQITDTDLKIHGNGIEGLQEATQPMDVGNSGTTIRLLMGLLAGGKGLSVLTGDTSIARRPMDRVVQPLLKMGANILGRGQGRFAPVVIQGASLKGIHYPTPIASAQVKSAILLAGLQASGITSVTEPAKSRDHTERMLGSFGIDLTTSHKTVSIMGGQTLQGTHICVPGDISSAAFLFAASVIKPGSKVTVESLGLNPTRTGILDVLSLMGAEITIECMENWGDEPVGKVTIQTDGLKGVEIGGDLIPRLIDELPILAVIATQAEGTTIIRNAEELKVKETNRISVMVQELRKLGAQIEETEDGMRIVGPTPLNGGLCHSHGDHRVGMALAIAGLVANEPVTIQGAEAIQVSFPAFASFLEEIQSSSKK